MSPLSWSTSWKSWRSTSTHSTTPLIFWWRSIPASTWSFIAFSAINSSGSSSPFSFAHQWSNGGRERANIWLAIPCSHIEVSSNGFFYTPTICLQKSLWVTTIKWVDKNVRGYLWSLGSARHTNNEGRDGHSGIEDKCFQLKPLQPEGQVGDDLSQDEDLEDLEYQRQQANNSRSIFKEGFQSWGKVPCYLAMRRSLKASKPVKTDHNIPTQTLSVNGSPFNCQNQNQHRHELHVPGGKHDITITVSIDLLFLSENYFEDKTILQK